jgi:uncharacterized membrane protein
MGWLHGLVTWAGYMDWLHGLVTWAGYMGWLHGLVTGLDWLSLPAVINRCFDSKNISKSATTPTVLFACSGSTASLGPHGWSGCAPMCSASFMHASGLAWPRSRG